MAVHIALIGLTTVCFLMAIVWIIHLVMKNAGVVDAFWGIGIVVLTAIYVICGCGFQPRKRMIYLMVAIWGFRLSTHIIRRMMQERSEDSRYKNIREAWKTHVPLKFFLFFEFQALLQTVLSVPFLFICLNKNPSIQWIEWVGAAIWLMALLGETIADQQLKSFRLNPQNKGKVCNIGLWNYSRHPNYFFEWLVWVGFAVFALGSPYGWTGIVSCLIMLHFLLNVSGVPMAEAQSIKSRGDLYREYQRTTSIFVPLPKRKVTSS